MNNFKNKGFLQIEERFIAVALHKPAESAKSVQILISPFGEERKSVQRMFYLLGEKSAEHGVATLRFDFSGNGDSNCEHRNRTIKDWLAELKELVMLAKKSYDEVILVGVRFGAMLALRTSQLVPISRLILVEPILNGEDMLHDLIRRQSIKNMLSGDANNQSGDDIWQCWQDGKTVDLGGYEICAELALAIKKYQLKSEFANFADDCLITCLKLSGAKKLPNSWQYLAEKFSKQPNITFELLRERPFWGQMDYYEPEVIIDYITKAIGGSHE